MKHLKYFENFTTQLKESPSRLDELQAEFKNEVKDIMYNVTDEFDNYREEWSLEEQSPFWVKYIFEVKKSEIATVYNLLCQTFKVFDSVGDFRYKIELLIKPVHIGYGGDYFHLTVPDADTDWNINQFLNKAINLSIKKNGVSTLRMYSIVDKLKQVFQNEPPFFVREYKFEWVVDIIG